VGLKKILVIRLSLLSWIGIHAGQNKHIIIG
jgi:hypothetical protein